MNRLRKTQAIQSSFIILHTLKVTTSNTTVQSARLRLGCRDVIPKLISQEKFQVNISSQLLLACIGGTSFVRVEGEISTVPIGHYMYIKSVCKESSVRQAGASGFAIGLVNSVINLPEGQVNFFEEFKLQKNSICASNVFGAS